MIDYSRWGLNSEDLMRDPSLTRTRWEHEVFPRVIILGSINERAIEIEMTVKEYLIMIREAQILIDEGERLRGKER
jgi:hypothetical protein